MTTPDLPERCCGRCERTYNSPLGPMPWCLEFSKYVAETEGTDCEAFEPADKEGTERE
jgi:hypothetical protein